MPLDTGIILLGTFRWHNQKELIYIHTYNVYIYSIVLFIWHDTENR